MFNGIFRGFTVFRRKDNIKGEQELSTPNLLILNNRQNFCRAIGIAAFRSRPWLDLRKARRRNDFLECLQGTARSTAFARAKSFQRIAQKILVSKRKILVSNHP